MKNKAFDEIHIGQFENKSTVVPSSSKVLDQWGLIGIKRIEYLKRAFDKGLIYDAPDPILTYLHRFLGMRTLRIASQCLSQAVIKWSNAKPMSIKKFKHWQKNFERFLQKISDTSRDLNRYHSQQCWREFETLLLSNEMRNEMNYMAYNHIDQTRYRNKLLHVRMRRFPLPSLDPQDALLLRMRALRKDLRVSEDTLETILAIFLLQTDESIASILKSAMETSGFHAISSMKFHPHCLCEMLGIPSAEFFQILSGPGGLIHIGLVEPDGSLNSELEKYLQGFTDRNLLSYYAEPISTLQALGLNRFPHVRETALLVNLIAGHQGERPLHILFHGTEGTGKTELAKSIASATGQILLDIGRDLEGNLPRTGQRQEDAITEFRLRALRITERHERGNQVILLVDEADYILNWAEKGVLNQFLEDTRLPILWISNSIRLVERSTLRRFDLHVSFSIAHSDTRQSLWESVVEKYNAHELFPPERRTILAQQFETSSGGIDLAVRNETALYACGFRIPIAENILAKHSELLSLKTNSHTNSRSPRYDASCLNLSRNQGEVLHAATEFANQLREKKTESNLTLLLYGPPGTGKTEFARYLARECRLPFEEISYARIASKYVGESEKELRRVFHQASETGALLFIDEADSLVGDRSTAHASWEISLINEFLIQLESCKCMAVCSTNFQNHLDAASRRRFHFHLEFGYLQEDGVRKMVEAFFPAIVHHPLFVESELDALRPLQMLTPGDFFAIHQRLRWLDPEEITLRLLYEELRKEEAAKNPYGQRRMGL